MLISLNGIGGFLLSLTTVLTKASSILESERDTLSAFPTFYRTMGTLLMPSTAHT